jgi:SAM-dependent methyltransferase
MQWAEENVLSGPRRIGHEQNVGRFRGKAKAPDPELDRSPMIQELVARLQFASTRIPFVGKNILDYGCGTGASLAWLQLHSQPGRCVGLDISEGAIDYAKRRYPGIDFLVLDAESPPQALRQEFDIAICLEVLEHLNNPNMALNHLAGHYLRPEGRLLVSTPNRMVFSAGAEVSPTNRTHIQEMDLNEFRSLLARHFARNKIWGMRFKDPARMQAHARMVRHACDGYRLFGEWWWNLTLSRLYHIFWRMEIWDVIRRQHVAFTKASHFEFVDQGDEINKCIWFVAISSLPKNSAATYKFS